MDVDEGNKAVSSPSRTRRESSFSANDFIWTLEKATDLLNELKSAKDSATPFFIDSTLIKIVTMKIDSISALKS